MKKYLFYGGLLLSRSYSSLTLIEKDHSPSVGHAIHTQAILSKSLTAPDKKSRPLFRILKKYRTTIIAFSGLLWFCNNHRPDKTIIRLKDWKQDF